MHKGGVTEQNNIELFVYGTLLLEETWHMLIARAPRLTPAKIKGFRRYKVKGAPYPGLWHDPSSQIVLGAVVELSKEELSCVDLYEGSEYTRQRVTIFVGQHE